MRAAIENKRVEPTVLRVAETFNSVGSTLCNNYLTQQSIEQPSHTKALSGRLISDSVCNSALIFLYVVENAAQNVLSNANVAQTETAKRFLLRNQGNLFSLVLDNMAKRSEMY